MNASIEIQNGVKTLSSAPADAKYYNNSGAPYTNVAEVNSQIPSALRGRGLTVNVAGVEYWYKDGILDGNLVVKVTGGGETHTHTNKAALDLINKDVNNNPTWNGGAWPGSGGAALDYSTDIEADKASTTKVSAIKTLYDWAAGKFAAIAHSHAYSSLTGLPTLFSGAWGDLTGKPTLFSGSYNDLTNKPTIPTTLSGLSEKSYNSLTDKPTIPTQYTDANVRASALTGATAATTLANVVATDTQLTAWGKFMKLYSSLKALAFKDTVDYATDVTNKPTIPAAQVNSDWNASSGLAQILNKPTIPAAQVQSDWNAVSGMGVVLNKPTIPAAYTHPTGDGNQHVPATGTTNSGKVLTAGAIAGSMTWETPASPTPADNSITNAKLSKTAVAGRIKGSKTPGDGSIEDLTAAEVRTLINVENDSQANKIESVKVGGVVLPIVNKEVQFEAITPSTVDVSTWTSGEERPIGARKDPATGLPVYEPNIEILDIYSLSNTYKWALETENNWLTSGAPNPYWISGWGLQGQRYQNNSYLYECVEDNKWVRYPLVAILDIYSVPSTEITKLTTSGNWTGVNYTGTVITGCYKGMRYISATHIYEFYDDNTPCRISRV